MPQRKPWSQEQDQILKHIYDDLGLKKWSQIARRMNQQYNMPIRTGKQCRQRYQNSLDSSIIKSQWTLEEELQLYKLHDQIGNKWVNIAKHIPGRTDNCVKNHFFSKLRKSVRKLNKIIMENFKKQFKQIRLLVINKIIQATDQKFKTFPSISNHLIYLSNRLKNMLLDYSKDQQNQIEGNLQLLKEMIFQVHQFTQTYKRKPKKLRKNPHVHANSHTSKANILIVPKVQRFKFAQDAQQNQSDYELASNQESIQIGDPNQTILNKIAKDQKIQMVMDNQELGKSMDKNIKQSMNDSLQKSSDVEIILRNAGILQNRNMFSMLFLKQSMSDSRNFEEKEKPQTFNFGDSIQNLNFLRQSKEEDVEMEHKLFENP